VRVFDKYRIPKYVTILLRITVTYIMVRRQYMPTLEPVVLMDRAPTPVAHTFNPRDTTAGVTTLTESTGVPIGERRITLSHTRSQNGRVRAIAKFAIPVVQDVEVNGITRPTVVKTNYADLVFNFDPTSTTQERKDLVGLVEDLLSPDLEMLDGFIVDLEGLF
jgi:hypothetical protein